MFPYFFSSKNISSNFHGWALFWQFSQRVSGVLIAPETNFSKFRKNFAKKAPQIIHFFVSFRDV
jgi:hypothetical protein